VVVPAVRPVLCTTRRAGHASRLTGGRPVRFGQVCFFVTRRRCHRSTVAGATSRCACSLLGRSPDQRGEDRAAGPVQPGPRGGAVQHGDLVPQHQQFRVFRCR
jgi:hypothetical protein